MKQGLWLTCRVMNGSWSMEVVQHERYGDHLRREVKGEVGGQTPSAEGCQKVRRVCNCKGWIGG